ncbi:MAG: T9SS type A sorting domain-containing protein, partial [Bacteroidetes bacterium]|nr:T9SS type A sorting domain-containing protein [Bacteroidota bacterium]
ITGDVYFTSGVHEKRFTTSLGCDSTYKLNLIIKENSDTVIRHTACVEYYWDLAKEWYNTTGRRVIRIPNSIGCDSIIELDLLISPVNVAIKKNIANQLEALATSSTYQWLDCDNNYSIISGENKRQFNLIKSGNYAVEVTTTAGCVDTSVCFNYTATGVPTPYSKYEIYPNPTSHLITIKGNIQNLQAVRLFSLQGKLLNEYLFNIEAHSYQLDINQPEGIYMLQVLTDDGVQAFVITKQ